VVMVRSYCCGPKRGLTIEFSGCEHLDEHSSPAEGLCKTIVSFYNHSPITMPGFFRSQNPKGNGAMIAFEGGSLQLWTYPDQKKVVALLYRENGVTQEDFDKLILQVNTHFKAQNHRIAEYP